MRVWILAALVLTACGGGDGDGGEAGGADAGGLAPDLGPPPEATGLSSLLIAPQSAQLRVGTPKQFNALGTYADGRTEDLTEVARWSSSAPDLVAVSDEAGSKGLATVFADGRITITARVGDVTAELTLGEACDYPDFSAQLALGAVLPPVAWDTAFGPDGQARPFSLADLHCDPDVTAIAFVLGAGWCGACSAYTQRLNAEAPAFEAAGGRIVYVEFEDANSEPADSRFAQEHIARLIGNGHGWRVGDLDTEPSPQYFASSGYINGGLPKVFVVRRSDMTVIADQVRSPDFLPFVEIANDPDRDWSDPAPPPFVNRCAAGDEEAGEPNDTADQATPLAAGTVRGGICAPGPDFYRIDHAGPWQVTLKFSHAQGDLDLFVWNTEQDKPLQINGLPVGSSTQTDNEGLRHEGPAVIKIQGFRSASAPYELVFETF